MTDLEKRGLQHLVKELRDKADKESKTYYVVEPQNDAQKEMGLKARGKMEGWREAAISLAALL